MATYAKVDVRIWGDKKVSSMTPIPPCGQGLWIRLLVSRHRSTIPGLLCVGEAALSEEFGWSLEDFRKAFAEASSLDMVKADWRARVIWIPKACCYNIPASPNVVRSWRIPWDETPECALKVEIYQHLKAFIEGLHEGFGKAFHQACAKPWANQDQDQKQDQEQEREKEPAPSSSTGNVNVKSAYDWLSYFQARYWELKGRQYGRGESDGKALGALGTLLGSLPNEQRAEDWEARARIVETFLASSDARTVSNGWSFSFFVSAFRGLALGGSRPRQGSRTEDVYDDLSKIVGRR